MEYRILAIVVNDDPDPSTLSMEHLVLYRLRHDGVVSVVAVAEVSNEHLQHAPYPDDSGAENDDPDGPCRPRVAEAGSPAHHTAA